jgi:hypothetical protein
MEKVMNSECHRRAVARRFVVNLAIAGLVIALSPLAWSEANDGRGPLVSDRRGHEDISDSTSMTEMRLLRCDGAAVEVEWVTPSFDTSREVVEGTEYQHVRLPGAGLTLQEGAPQLPARMVTVGIPVGVEVRAEVVLTEVDHIPDVQVYPAPQRVIRQTDDGQPYTDEEFYRDEARYDRDALYPARIVEVVETAYLRDQRVARVELRPLQTNPVTRELLWHRRIVFRLNFLGGKADDGWDDDIWAMSPGSGGPFEPVLEKVLLNYESSKKWRGRPADLAVPKATDTETPYDDSTAYKIAISEDGLYSMSYEYLQGQGVKVIDIDPRTVKIACQGRQIPIYVSGARDGRFDPGDAIQFWGELNYGDQHYYDPYTHTNVYWLYWGGEFGLRMVEQDGSLMEEDPDSLIVPDHYRTFLHLEQDLSYERLSQISDESVDRWLWEEFKADTTRDYAFELYNIVDTMECEVEVRLRGLTFPTQRPNHHTKIWLNGHPLVTDLWNDQDEYIFHRDDLPGTYLWEGDNLLRISNLGDTDAGEVDKVRLNWIQIDYWRQYQAVRNVLQFASPQDGPLGLYEYHLKGFTSDDIEIFDLAGKKIVNADISPDSSFYEVIFQNRVVRPTQYIALSRNLMKLPVAVTPNSASNLHDATNGADHIIIVHPDFYDNTLSLADFRRSQGLRVAVVRVDDIYDEFNDGVLSPVAIRDFLRYAYQHWISPAPASVLLVGDTSWGYDKPITHRAYWTQHCYVPTMMAWTSAWGTSAADSRLVCLVGDDKVPDMFVGRFPVSTAEQTDVIVNKVVQYEADPLIGPWRKRIQLLAGEGATFERACVDLDSAFVPVGYDVPRIYTASGSVHFGTTQDLLDQWKEGVALATFTGHGGGSVWFDANFFLLEHVPLLENGRRLPVVLSLTCFVGFFDNHQQSSLGEEVLRAEDKGAVAHFGSSSVAWANEDNMLGQNIFEAIFDDGVRDLGRLFTLGKLGPRRISQELVDIFNLLGDPATRLGLPEESVSLDLPDHSLPHEEPISLTGSLPGGLGGNVEISFGEVDSTGWMADTTRIDAADKVYAPRIPTVQETLSADGGNFNWQVTLPDTMPEYPYYRPTGGLKAVRAYFWNDHTDAIGWAPVYLDIPYIHDIRHEPEEPLAWEDVHILADVDLGSGLDPDGPDTVMVQWGLRNTWLYNDIPMSLQSGSTYRTTEPLSAQGGATIYYRIVVSYGGVGGSPSTHTDTSSVRSFPIARVPNLWVARRDLSAFVQSNQFSIGAWIHNTGVVALDSVLIHFYDDHPDSNRRIGEDQWITVPANDSTFVSVPWEGPGESHDVYVWLDPYGQVAQAPTFDDRADRVFTNLFLVTTQQGSSVRGANVRVCHASRNVGCQIAPGSTNLSSLLSIDDQGADSAYYAEKYQPATYYQPGLSLATMRDSSQAAYGLIWSDTTAALNSGGADLTFWYDSQDSLTSLAVQMDRLKICRFVSEVQRWVLLPQQAVLPESSMVQVQVDELGIFGLFMVSDDQMPLVRINVEGQSFADGDYISSNPIISTAIEDENGIDLSPAAVEVTLNGNPVAGDEYSLDYSPHTSNLSLLTFAPNLSPGPYIFKVEAQDCLGNSAVDSISFNVTAGFQIPFVANHPNPFQTETIFAFVVASDAPAEQVLLKIYTVRGRLIREFRRRSVGPGYVEIVWDGRDSEGEMVANGVYYYKMSVTGGNGEKSSPIVGKMAKLE